MTVEIHQVRDLAGCERCHVLAAAVWGSDAACSTAQMIVHATYGGVVLLARAEDRDIGFLFSFPAIYEGEFVLWSHETAIVPGLEHKGIGYQLKMRQREIARDLGYAHVMWTFDPLVSRNAYFNLHKLGAQIVAYKRNVYGTDESDLVNQGMETDRFIAAWDTKPKENVNHIAEQEPGVPLLVHGESQEPELRAGSARHVTTEIPLDIGELLKQKRDLAFDWRYAFREVAESLWTQGYRPVSVTRLNTAAMYTWETKGDFA